MGSQILILKGNQSWVEVKPQVAWAGVMDMISIFIICISEACDVLLIASLSLNVLYFAVQWSLSRPSISLSHGSNILIESWSRIRRCYASTSHPQMLCSRLRLWVEVSHWVLTHFCSILGGVSASCRDNLLTLPIDPPWTTNLCVTLSWANRSILTLWLYCSVARPYSPFRTLYLLRLC